MSLLGKVGKTAVGLKLSTMAAGAVGLGSPAGIAAFTGVKAGGAALRGSRRLAAKTVALHEGSRFAGNKMLGVAARHPIATGAGIYSVGSAYHRLPGASRSRRNQNDPYLKRVRNHQRSSAISGLLGHSSGSFA